jgi:hypothetical protein
VDVKETGCRQCKVAQWSSGVAGAVRALAGLACLATRSVVRPASLLLCAGVRQLVDGLEHFEPKGSRNVRPRIPGRCVAVDGDSGAGNQLLLKPQGGY